MKNSLQISSLLLFMLFSCIDPVNVDVESEAGNLVVDALITDEEGPYSVKLFYSTGYFDNSRSNPASGADVFILAGNGSIIQLNESSAGLYTTPTSFKGQVGTSYVLNITLSNGKSYRSLPETLSANAGIDTLAFSYEVKNEVSKENVVTDYDGINVLLTTGDVSASPFYRWRYSATYEILTFPEQKTIKVELQTIPDPPACSGYIYDALTETLMQVAPCTCCRCWVDEFSQKVIVSKPEFISGQIQNFNIGFIRDEKGRFGFKYYIEVEQLSLSKGAHEFWSQVEQQQNQGSLFDQPTGRIKSNIQSIDDPNEIVLGYFSASSVKKVSGFITSALFPINVSTGDIIQDDCTKLPNSTNQRPPFW
ncbi:MAG: DUF4249 domain-containing protein [Fulvivirga sp.]|uniref:DUF4249 domain-containing protein n=1 Tax=Fulvivirga sp. TaxID=1931237 RepID=UPI0032ED334D